MHQHSTRGHAPSLERTALSATVHCLTGCAIGEVLVAMSAGLGTGLFWGRLVFSLAVAGVAAYPVNYWLISRGRGHAVLHEHHHHGGSRP